MIYLDGLASWPMRPEAKSALLDAIAQPGNANSNHVAGWQADKQYEAGRKAVADLVKAMPHEIFITSGATEANALAIIGSARAAMEQQSDRKKIVVSAIEHDAVRGPVNVLRHLGFEVEVCPVDSGGSICLESMNSLLDENTLLVSVMLVSNLTGVSQPIEKICKMAKGVGALVHADAAQAVGKIEIDVFELGLDYLSISAHKFGGPQGVGALYVSANSLKPYELTTAAPIKEHLSGTQPAALVAAMGRAAEVSMKNMAREAIHSRNLISLIGEQLANGPMRAKRLFASSPAVPGAAAFLLDTPSTSDLIDAVNVKVCISNASACHSGSIGPSPVLSALHLPYDAQRRFLRVGVGWWLSARDIFTAIEAINEGAAKVQLATGGVHQ